jgi:hypothetical protein
MNNHVEKIKNSLFVDISRISHDQIFKNRYANYWRALHKLLIGVSDIRARIGSFNTPWRAKSNPQYIAPEFKFINERLNELLDLRALKIHHNSLKYNKRIAIMWSGGIDSTLVLTAFLKNISLADQKNIIVILDTNSILENFNFYSKYINNKLECLHYQSLELTENFLDKHILLHGDPGDCLFGPSSPMYRYFINRGEHLQPWRNHLDRMAELLEPNASHGIHAPGFGRWYVDKITRNLEESGQADYVSTIADWWWWTYYNFKWEFSCQRPFFYVRKNFTSNIPTTQVKEYAENVFFNTDKFQLWSYSNLKSHIVQNFSSITHKEQAKNYIFEFTKDYDYLKNKKKTDATPANWDEKSNYRTPIFYDKNYVGHSLDRSKKDFKLMLQTLVLLLERYKG